MNENYYLKYNSKTVYFLMDGTLYLEIYSTVFTLSFKIIVLLYSFFLLLYSDLGNLMLQACCLRDFLLCLISFKWRVEKVVCCCLATLQRRRKCRIQVFSFSFQLQYNLYPSTFLYKSIENYLI